MLIGCISKFSEKKNKKHVLFETFINHHKSMITDLMFRNFHGHDIMSYILRSRITQTSVQHTQKWD